MILSSRLNCILANILLAGAIVLFAAGFFPHKAFLPGLAQWPLDQDGPASPPPFDRVIFMVVDALRSDFVYSSTSRFLFTQNLIRSGAAIPFDGHASAPTITMPRIKAITTGSVPSFLDVVLNFAESDTTSTLAHQDSWVAQSKAKSGRKLAMYGDDTWLKLFPDFFDRFDGTTSFFVSDFTEVDQNVTRHLPAELAHDDWSVMVLHYLGLDHIGHKAGPQSVNMAPKQEEMDRIVNEIYHAMEHNAHLTSSLLVLCGDHGMNEAGNHGGSSSGEVTTALTFISPNFREKFDGLKSPKLATSQYSFYDQVEQSDITPSLAALLGFPIPLNNLGILIPKFLDLWPEDLRKLDLVDANARQIADLAMTTYGEEFKDDVLLDNCRRIPSDDLTLPCAWREASHAVQAAREDETLAAEAIDLNFRFMRLAQSQLSGTASNYNLVKMFGGICFAMSGVLLAIVSIPRGVFDNFASNTVTILILICQSMTMFASSYVEEEHQFWYWASSGWLTYLAINQQRFLSSSSASPIRKLLFPLTLVAFGIVRRINSTGQKYAALPSISSAIFTAEPWLLWSLIIFAYLVTCRDLIRDASRWSGKDSRQLTLLPVPVCMAAFAFKVSFAHADSPELLQGFPILRPLIAVASRYALVGQARIVFLGIAHMLVCALYYEAPWKKQNIIQRRADSIIHTFHHILTLFLLTQSRVTNIPVFLLYSLQFACLRAQASFFGNTVEVALTSLLFQQSSFYAFGGTNAISSVDLSLAYNGISGYNVLLVGLLTFVSNWAGSIWWASATGLLLVERAQADRCEGEGIFFATPTATLPKPAETDTVGAEPDKSSSLGLQNIFFVQFALLTLFTTASTLSVMVACTLLREHLFIWTVFSPKYLYIAAWAFGQHFLVNGLFVWGLLSRLCAG